MDYGGYTVPLAFLGRHAAGNAAMAVELALALCRKGFDISDEAILDGLAAVDNRSSIRVLSQRPLVILDACRTPQQAAALLRVLNMAKVRHMSAVIGLTEEEGAEAFFSALETGLTPEEQKKDKSTMPGMSENPFDKVFLVTPSGGTEPPDRAPAGKGTFHFDAELCTSLDEAVQLAHANSRRGLLVCGSEAIALEAAALLAKRSYRHPFLKNDQRACTLRLCVQALFFCKKGDGQAMATVTFSAADEVLYAYLVGEIDHDAAQSLRIQLDDALVSRTPRTLVLDLGGVGFMDSSGVGLILGRQRCARTLGTLRIQHAPAQLRRVLRLAGIPWWAGYRRNEQ